MRSTYGAFIAGAGLETRGLALVAGEVSRR
jgi:hypothetical protein